MSDTFEHKVIKWLKPLLKEAAESSECALIFFAYRDGENVRLARQTFDFPRDDCVKSAEWLIEDLIHELDANRRAV